MLYGDAAAPPLFTENDTNHARLFGRPNAAPYVKDGINDYVVDGVAAVNPAGEGAKAAMDHALTVGAGQTEVIRPPAR